jgi:sugar/nucleoside kinase (ribokinase family)
MSLVVIGTVAFDAIETPFGKTDKIVGGAATYASLAASYFYDKTKIVAVVGDDFPQPEIDDLNKHNIDTEGLQIKKGEKSFFWSGKYHNDMNSRDTLITELNVLADFDPIIPESYQDCEYLMLGNLTPQVQQTVIKRLKKRPKLIVMDTMNFWMDIAMDDLLETIKMIDVLTINDAEARQLSGEHSLVKAARKILAMGPKYLIIKKGEHGALLFSDDLIFSAPALPLAKVGTINFNNMKNAIIYGSALASFCVEKFGTEKLKNLTQEEVAGRIQEFVTLSQFAIIS